MSKEKNNPPDYIVHAIKRFYACRETPITDPYECRNEFLSFLEGRDEFEYAFSLSELEKILEVTKEVITHEPLPKDDTAKFHRMVGAIAGYLHKNNIW